MKSKKKEMPRSFYYKVTKALCKMLKCECLVYEKPRSWSWRGGEAICVQTVLGEKFPLVVEKIGGRRMFLCLKKNADKRDLQKEMVKRVIKEVEKNDVTVFYSMSYGFDNPVVPKGTCFEKFAVEFDLERAVKGVK